MSSTRRTAPLPQRVFQRLDDQAFQSGEALAADLSVTRAAVWKAVEQLRELGVALDAQPNKGYRLAPGVSALSVERIQALLPADVRARIEALLVEWTLESTNTKLLEALPPARRHAPPWCSPNTRPAGAAGAGAAGSRRPAAPSACRSAWQYPDMPADLSALSLVVGLCAS